MLYKRLALLTLVLGFMITIGFTVKAHKPFQLAFVASAGSVTLDVLKQYVQNQKGV